MTDSEQRANALSSVKSTDQAEKAGIEGIPATTTSRGEGNQKEQRSKMTNDTSQYWKVLY